MLLVIDNYDSFTYNLVQYLRELGAEVAVHRNDRITLDEIRVLQPEQIVLSPGPCSPAEAGICCDIIRAFGASLPLLGVCLGHQCIGAAYGGRIVRAARLMHGKTSPIRHDGLGRVPGAPQPLRRDPLPLAAHRAGDAARLLDGVGGDGRRGDHGRASPRAPGVRACSSIPSPS